MTNPLPSLPPPQDPNGCWTRVGVWGNKMCPKLKHHIHCINCPLYRGAGKFLLERPAPSGYCKNWERELKQPLKQTTKKQASVLIFRVRAQWLALTSLCIQEITEKSPIHALPHRLNATVLGLTNVRGQLQIVISLHRLLALKDTNQKPSLSHRVYPRMLVFYNENQSFVFPVDEVYGIHSFKTEDYKNSSTAFESNEIFSSFVKSFFSFKGKRGALLREDILFQRLIESYL